MLLLSPYVTEADVKIPLEESAMSCIRIVDLWDVYDGRSQIAFWNETYEFIRQSLGDFGDRDHDSSPFLSLSSVLSGLEDFMPWGE